MTEETQQTNDVLIFNNEVMDDLIDVFRKHDIEIKDALGYTVALSVSFICTAANDPEGFVKTVAEDLIRNVYLNVKREKDQGK